jgi:cytochrome P450
MNSMRRRGTAARDAELTSVSIVSDPVVDALLMQVLITPEGRADPYPLYAQIRAAAPLCRTSFGPLVASGYADCLAVLRDPHLGRGADSARGGGLMPGGEGSGRRGEFFELSRHNMLLADPPDHTRLRQLVSRTFTPRRVDELRPAVQALVDELLDEMAEATDVDFMSAFALPLPMAVIGELVGVPAADRAVLQPLVRAVAKGIEPILSEEENDAAIAAIDELGTYFGDLLEDRRRRPANDLLTGLAEARDRDDRLTDYEVCSTAILLFAAGFETTTNLLGNGLLALLRHPDQLAAWRADPGLGATAVDELLRWDSPVQLNLRAALEPADLHGAVIEPGQRIIVLQGAANRDGLHFPNPETLDLARRDNVPMSFGSGIHHCIGAALARMETDLALTTLLQRFETIDLLDDEPEWRASFTLRGLLALPLHVH